MCPSQVLAKISINCREKRIEHQGMTASRPSCLKFDGCPSRRSLSLGARGECAKDSQQPNIVSVAKERADIDKLSIADLMKRSRNFFFLGCSEEPGAFGEFAELNSGSEMPVNGALHKASGACDFID
jgi:hypothetical protein